MYRQDTRENEAAGITVPTELGQSFDDSDRLRIMPDGEDGERAPEAGRA